MEIAPVERVINGSSETAVDDADLAGASERRASAQPTRSTPLLMRRFNFVSRPPSSVKSPMQHDDDALSLPPPSRPLKSRKRKGSLRKTALLGPGRIKQEPPATSPTSDLLPDDVSTSLDEALHDALNSSHHHPHRLSLVSEDLPTTSPPGVPPPPVQSDLASPIVSPTSQSYASTTDDDDLSMAATLNSPASYFDPQPVTVARRRSSQKNVPSPLSAVPVLDYNADDGYDYAETERWGWVVLIVTWVVFAVGMGSCLGVWSWAWDVGQTPYAPPELEDDPTLPIVGYYPALIILTAVMAWVWVVVAWVGMKYFKHAKIQGDD